MPYCAWGWYGDWYGYKCVCQACPAGFYAPPGATQCSSCVATDQWEITLCDGSTTCTPACTSADGTSCGATSA